MKVLVINSGSSSIKYQLFSMPSQEVICAGLVERIGFKDANIHYKTAAFSIDDELHISNHKEGLQKVVAMLMDAKNGVISSTDEIKIVGHRIVHGGNSFADTSIINKEVKEKIKALFSLAPQHNPANLEGVEIAEAIFTSAKQVAVFDTAFHQSIPQKAHKYAIPNHLYDKEHIKMYGFHGTSHKYVSEKATAYLKTTKSNMLTIHLGNGCSITAVKDGKSIDHSLGFGPVNGLIMGTRSGDIDQTILFYLINSLGYTLEGVNKMLQKESGMLGLTGFSDLREIEKAAINGNKECLLALDMNVYRIKKYIGAYVAAMNGLDAVVFTAGIGENSSYIRKKVCEEMDFYGIVIDDKLNEAHINALTEIQVKDAKVKVLVIPTNEELEIAKQAFTLCEN